MPRVVFELTITVIGLRCEWRTEEGKTVTLLQEGYCISTCVQRLNKITTIFNVDIANFQTETRNRDLRMPSFACVSLTVSLQPCSSASTYDLIVGGDTEIRYCMYTECIWNAWTKFRRELPTKMTKMVRIYLFPQTLSFRSTAQQHVEIFQLN